MIEDRRICHNIESACPSDIYAADSEKKLCIPGCAKECKQCPEFQALVNGTCVKKCPAETIPIVRPPVELGLFAPATKIHEAVKLLT